ncbi:glycosyltransferase family 9 protein [Pseudodesulfovibrio tunisiensis]|uniref:glycosyltransferase family 9 protein n=1 Tax=Pseudodesulfovibrio tunisiensis TaxID=463192 RepID=UPI00311D4D94
MLNSRPILVLQMQRMGDLILTYPLLLWLARTHPDREIMVVAERMFYEPLMRLSPKATYIPWDGVHVLKGKHFHTVINLSIRDQAARLAHDVDAETAIGPVMSPNNVRRVLGNWQLYRTGLVDNNRYNRFHWADLNALDSVPPEIMAKTAFDPPRTLPPGQNRIGLFLGASEQAKRPTPQFWAELVRELLNRGLRPVLFGGPAEIELGREVALMANVPVLDLCGKLGLDEFAIVGQTLCLFITPDTGPMHLAAWTGLKCLNLSMGNVSPWETGPYQPGHFVLRPDMECAEGCWSCTRDRLHCHDPFVPGRIAALAARAALGAEADKLGRMRIPGLRLFQSARTDQGLYRLHPCGDQSPTRGDMTGNFWAAFFRHAFSLENRESVARAWHDLGTAFPDAVETMTEHLPELGSIFSRHLASRSPLSANFRTNAPRELAPFTGFIQMFLPNQDYAPKAWAHAASLLEVLSELARQS